MNYKKDVYPYIFDCIDFSDYDINPETEKEQLQEVFNEFNRVAVYPNNLKRFGNYQLMFADYLMGLPSNFNVDFENYKILKIAKKWGSIPEEATEKQEDKILSNWWNFIASNTFKLFRKYKIDMNYNC